ncbi:MAG: signal peptidase II [Clostridia bacterium]|nr:signal peptidase II [Clostridia bacterium]
MNKKVWWKIGVMCAIIVAVVVLDLVTKYVFDAQLAGGETISVIPYLFNFKLVHNMGAAWGLMAGKQVFLVVLSIVFLAIFIFYYIKEKNKSWLLTIAYGFLIAGCLGNMFDRIAFGYVRDFIQFAFWPNFPIFNFADVFLCVGVLLFFIYLIIYFVRMYKKDKKEKIVEVEEPKDRKDD